jgi:hypothetical protein
MTRGADDGELRGISATNLVRFRHGGVVFDQSTGLGAVPNVENIEYMGFVVLMKPSTFLSVCTAIDADEFETEKNAHFASLIEAGKPISMGFLRIDLESPEFQVEGHEGRHRAKAILAVFGDDPIPVAVFPSYGDRARHVKEEHLERLARGIRRELSIPEASVPGFVPPFIEGPLFERVFILGREMHISPEREAQFTPC